MDKWVKRPPYKGRSGMYHKMHYKKPGMTACGKAVTDDWGSIQENFTPPIFDQCTRCIDKRTYFKKRK